MSVELLHIVQRKDAVAERHKLSGAIGLGVKSQLLEELTQFEEADTRLQVERGRVLLAAGEERLRAAGAKAIRPLHRHGGIVETIIEREADARVVVIGKRGASHEFAQDHIGSKVERVVRASNKPILIASRSVEPPRCAVLAYGAILIMGAYEHSPLKTLIIGSTTTAMVRTVRIPVLLMR